MNYTEHICNKYTRGELSLVCKGLGLKQTGGKREIARRVSRQLQRGGMPISDNKVSMAFYIPEKGINKDWDDEKIKEHFRKNIRNYQKENIDYKYKNFSRRKIPIYLYVYIIPNWEENVIENYYNYPRNSSHKNLERYYKLLLQVCNEELVNGKDGIEISSFLDFIKKTETVEKYNSLMRFLTNLLANGSNIDLIKIILIIKENWYNNLVLDTNAIITSYEDLINDTFFRKIQEDGFSVFYYTNHININNKLHYFKKNSVLIDKLSKRYYTFIEKYKDISTNKIKGPESNVIFDNVFRNFLLDAGLCDKYQYGLKSKGGPKYHYMIKLFLNEGTQNQKYIQDVLRLTKYIVGVINMSWCSKKDSDAAVCTREVNSLKGDIKNFDNGDATIDLNAYLYMLKKYLVTGTIEGICGEDGIEFIVPWNIIRKHLIALSDEKFDYSCLQSFTQLNFLTLRRLCHVAYKIKDFNTFIEYLQQKPNITKNKELQMCYLVNQYLGMFSNEEESAIPADWKTVL